MTPDEHAAEAERILTAVQALADPTTLEINANLARAHIHALLATRPTPPAPPFTGGGLRPGDTVRVVDGRIMRDVGVHAEPLPPPFTGGERMTWIPDVGYSSQPPTPDPVDRVFAALWDALEPDMENRPAPDTVRRWAAEAVAALTSPAPTTET